MTDYTSEIVRLQRARLDMQTAKKTAEINVKERYAKKIRDEIKYETEQAELEFARALKEAHDRGVPSSLLRSEVLRTNVWNRWTYWRDLAMIEPDRVVVQNAREAKARENATYVWSDDYKTLTVLRGTDGKLLDTAIVYEMPERLKKVGGDVYWPVPVDEAVERVAYEGNQAYIKNLSAEISAQIEAGNVPGPNSN